MSTRKYGVHPVFGWRQVVNPMTWLELGLEGEHASEGSL